MQQYAGEIHVYIANYSNFVQYCKTFACKIFAFRGTFSPGTRQLSLQNVFSHCKAEGTDQERMYVYRYTTVLSQYLSRQRVQS